MRKDLTDITLVVDRSGSMGTCKVEAQGGINAFITDQKSKPGEANFSLLQFDTEHEYIFKGVPIKQVEKYELIPRGMTALLDAIGRAINETGERLKVLAEADRPGLVVIAIITDGEENSSHEFNKSQIKSMIEHQQTAYQWQFTFLGANQDAFAEAGAMGFQAAATANYNVHASGATYDALSSNVSQMRFSTSTGGIVSNTYTDDERKKMSQP
jgi:uncharacterized protein YegL